MANQIDNMRKILQLISLANNIEKDKWRGLKVKLKWVFWYAGYFDIEQNINYNLDCYFLYLIF